MNCGENDFESGRKEGHRETFRPGLCGKKFGLTGEGPADSRLVHRSRDNPCDLSAPRCIACSFEICESALTGCALNIAPGNWTRGTGSFEKIQKRRVFGFVRMFDPPVFQAWIESNDMSLECRSIRVKDPPGDADQAGIAFKMTSSPIPEGSPDEIPMRCVMGRWGTAV
jgi:hypothetical protein